MTGERKIRVLVVDDSPFMRQLISNAISNSDDIVVVGTARNGEEAVQKCRDLRPDVLTLDIEMPVLNGLVALEIIMREMPTPVIMVSSLTRVGATETFRALEMGAVDFITKPDRAAATAELGTLLLPRLRAAAGVNRQKVVPRTVPSALAPKHYDLVVIGCSTGGPAALQQIIPTLPEGMRVPLVIAQHIPAGFTGPMAQRLGQLSRVPVVEAFDGMPLLSGTVYIAPGGCHTAVRKDKTRRFLQVLPFDYVTTPFRPSVNVLFQSAEPFAPHLLAVVLTGMGQDGAEGAKILHRSGAHVVAESEESAIIYGMPRAIVEAKLADGVMNLRQVGEFLKIATMK
ncbi:MAG: chemotaxis response regulator protein-glutamate methylesterase [Peptococcaceae bacterium]|nr:chemotaxis response regulator protein-glutamate methylesterase [Peptococcaceae bacterium]